MKDGEVEDIPERCSGHRTYDVHNHYDRGTVSTFGHPDRLLLNGLTVQV